MDGRNEALLDATRSYALLCLGCAGAAVTMRAVPGFDAFVSFAVAGLLFFGGERAIERMPGGPERAGTTLGGIFTADPDDRSPFGVRSLVASIARAVVPALRETAVALAVCAVVFPPFVFGYAQWFGLSGHVDWVWPAGLAQLALSQVVLVAVPEEVFFRGYLQTRLTDAFPARHTVRGVAIPLGAIVLQAAAFGVLHFVTEPRPERLAVAFPALLFGLVRAFRGGIGASVALHVACNLYAEVLALSVR